MVDFIRHNFVSTKPDSADTTLVSSSEWNDGHTLDGGINGQVLIYDSTMPNNMRWTDNVSTIVILSYSIVSSTPTPIENVLSIPVTTNSPVVGLSAFVVGNYTSVGAAIMFVSHRVNGVDLYTPAILSAANFYQSFTADVQLPTPGAHVIDFKLTTVGNVNILTLHMSHRLILFGV